MLFCCLTGSFIRVHTPDQYDKYNRWWISTENTEHVKFKVKACNDVRIALGMYLGADNRNSYEIVIGTNNNAFSSIKKVLRVSFLR